MPMFANICLPLPWPDKSHSHKSSRRLRFGQTCRCGAIYLNATLGRLEQLLAVKHFQDNGYSNHLITDVEVHYPQKCAADHECPEGGFNHKAVVIQPMGFRDFSDAMPDA